MALQTGGIRITYLLFLVCLLVCILRSHGENNGIRRKRDIRGDTAKLVGKGISPALRFLRALNAKTVLLADTAKVRQRNERIKVYAKLG